MTVPVELLWIFSTIGALSLGGAIGYIFWNISWYIRHKSWPMSQAELKMITSDEKFEQLKINNETLATSNKELENELKTTLNKLVETIR